MGFRSHLIVWDWEKKCEILRHELHKVRVQGLCFSSDDEHLISLGGKDCGMIIVWNINKKYCAKNFSKISQMTFSLLAWQFAVKWQRERRLAKQQSLVDCIREAESLFPVEIVIFFFNIWCCLKILLRGREGGERHHFCTAPIELMYYPQKISDYGNSTHQPVAFPLKT